MTEATLNLIISSATTVLLAVIAIGAKKTHNKVDKIDKKTDIIARGVHVDDVPQLSQHHRRWYDA